MHPFTAVRARLAHLVAAAILAAPVTYAHAQADAFQEVIRLMHEAQYAQALARADDVLAARPKDAQMRFLKGVILTEQKKTAAAIEMFAQLTTDFPELPEPYNNLAVIYAAQGQYDQARVALETALRVAPSWAVAQENLGDIHLQLAEQAYAKAAALEPSNAAVARKLAQARSLYARPPAAQ